MARPDIADQLVHFTRGANLTEAFGNLCSIIDQRSIRGNNALIRGGYRCVCFSEAPLKSLVNGLVNPAAYSRYSPFGIVFEKRWIFDQGGRPVIYQPDDEYTTLNETHRWRHMRYEPTNHDPVDFTWEREWRIRTDALQFDPAHAGIVVPEGDWTRLLRDADDEQQAWQVFEYSQVLDMHLAEEYREPFGWRIFPIGV